MMMIMKRRNQRWIFGDASKVTNEESGERFLCGMQFKRSKVLRRLRELRWRECNNLQRCVENEQDTLFDIWVCLSWNGHQKQAGTPGRTPEDNKVEHDITVGFGLNLWAISFGYTAYIEWGYQKQRSFLTIGYILIWKFFFLKIYKNLKYELQTLGWEIYLWASSRNACTAVSRKNITTQSDSA